MPVVVEPVFGVARVAADTSAIHPAAFGAGTIVIYDEGGPTSDALHPGALAGARRLASRLLWQNPEVRAGGGGGGGAGALVY